MKNSYLTVTDQFCGAGGSSQGVRNAAQRIKGMEVKMAMNHWKLAIETHNTNFPETLHDCTDVSAADPRRYPSTHILVTSPECTNHSLANGKKRLKAQMDMFDKGVLDPSAERSRATMWDVCRFAEYHKYEGIIVENVVDARTWILWESWLKAMHALGYLHECVYRNSMHFHPTPQSRDRLYVVFWKKGNKKPDLNFYPIAFCPTCAKDVHSIQSWKNPAKPYGKYRQQYVYRCPKHTTIVEPYYYAAWNCIDWTIQGTRIGDRIKPLSPITENRCRAGLAKYGQDPFIIHAAYSHHARGTERHAAQPFFTQTTFSSQALVHHQPFIINDQHSTGIEFRVKSVGETMSTIPSSHSLRLVTPPVIVKAEHSKQDGYYRSALEPLQTQTTRQTMGIVTPESFRAFLSYYYSGSCQNEPLTEAVNTVTTNDRIALVEFTNPKLEDCYYRMIRAKEVKLAMAFAKDYKVLGSEKDQVKQCGNAVTPPAMEALIERLALSLMN